MSEPVEVRGQGEPGSLGHGSAPDLTVRPAIPRQAPSPHPLERVREGLVPSAL